jgi:hypothetical protein
MVRLRPKTCSRNGSRRSTKTNQTTRQTPTGSSQSYSINQSPEPSFKKQKLTYGIYKEKVIEEDRQNVDKTIVDVVEDSINVRYQWSEESEYSENDEHETSLSEAMSQSVLLQNAIHSERKYRTLSEAEVSVLSNFVRRTVFRRIKFINDALMRKLLPEIYDRLKIKNSDDREKKTYDLIKFTKETLRSRRGYSTIIFCNKLRGKPY